MVQRNIEHYIQDYVNLKFEDIQEKYRFKRLVQLLSEMRVEQNFKNILEVGPGRNTVSELFADFDNYIILEPIEYFSSSFPPVNGKFQLRRETIESFISSGPKEDFDLVILSSVLHELEDPEALLLKLKDVIATGSKVVVVVPNNLSLHRLIGELEGHAKAGPILTETERRMQQNTSFSVESMQEFASAAGYLVKEIFTSFVKPHPHFRMHELMAQDIISELELDSLYSISKILEPYGSEIFAVLEKSND
jgi:SAM-dependent methyltransferase